MYFFGLVINRRPYTVDITQRQVVGATNRSKGYKEYAFILLYKEIDTLIDTDPNRTFCFHRLTLSHNEALTSYLLRALSASPDLHDADTDDIIC